MKKIILFLTLVVIGNFAHADANIINYGRDLCEVVVSFRNPTQRGCEDWVTKNSDNNVYSVALNVCVGFSWGPSKRTSDCFTRASQWINDQNVKDQTELCEARNGNYDPRAECLRNLFFEKNMQEYQTPRQRTPPQARSRSGVS